MTEHLWLRDLRSHPDGEVCLYVDGKLVSGTTAAQITASVDEALRHMKALAHEAGWDAAHAYLAATALREQP